MAIKAITPEVKTAIANAIVNSYGNVNLSQVQKGTPQYSYYFAKILNEAVFTTSNGTKHTLLKPLKVNGKTITPYCKDEDDALHITNKILGQLCRTELVQVRSAQV